MYTLINPRANASLQRTITNYQYEDMDPTIQSLYEAKFQDDSRDDNLDESKQSLPLEGPSIFSTNDDDSDDSSQRTAETFGDSGGFGGGDFGGAGASGDWTPDTDSGSEGTESNDGDDDSGSPDDGDSDNGGGEDD